MKEILIVDDYLKKTNKQTKTKTKLIWSLNLQCLFKYSLSFI